MAGNNGVLMGKFRRPVKSSRNVLLVLPLVLCAFAPSASAQEFGDAAQDAAREASEPVCMATSLRNVDAVAEQSRGQRYTIIVAGDDAAELEEKGYSLLDCRAAGFANESAIAEHRDEVCIFAYLGIDATYERFESAMGVRPDLLCSSAERVAGVWTRPDVD